MQVGISNKPMRTCIGCRRTDAKSALVRLVAQGGVAIVDREARLPGRGAYVHPTRECLQAAQGALPRALRQPIKGDLEWKAEA